MLGKLVIFTSFFWIVCPACSAGNLTHMLEKHRKTNGNNLPFNTTEKLLNSKFVDKQAIEKAYKSLFGNLKTDSNEVKYIAKRAATCYAAWIRLLETFEQPDAFALMNTLPRQGIKMLLDGTRLTELINNGVRVADKNFDRVKFGKRVADVHEREILTRSVIVSLLLSPYVMHNAFLKKLPTKTGQDAKIFEHYKKRNEELLLAIEAFTIQSLLTSKMRESNYIEHAAYVFAIIHKTFVDYYWMGQGFKFDHELSKKLRSHYPSTLSNVEIQRFEEEVIKTLKDQEFNNRVSDALRNIALAINAPELKTSLTNEVYGVVGQKIDMAHEVSKKLLSGSRKGMLPARELYSTFLDRKGELKLFEGAKDPFLRGDRVQVAGEATMVAQRGIAFNKGEQVSNVVPTFFDNRSYNVGARNLYKSQNPVKLNRDWRLLVHRDFNPFPMIFGHEKIPENISFANLAQYKQDGKSNKPHPSFNIVNADALDVVYLLATNPSEILKDIIKPIFNPAVLNLANKGPKVDSIGGGVLTKGSVAQEEEILRRMGGLLATYVKAYKTMSKGLTTNGHEIEEFGVLVTPFAYSHGGNIVTSYAPNPFQSVVCTVIAAHGYILAIRNDVRTPKDKVMTVNFLKNIIKKKMTIFQAATRHKKSTLVLGALGLGAFIGNNNASLSYEEKRVYRRLNAAIDRTLIYFFFNNYRIIENVVYAIMLPTSNDTDNYDSYVEVFADWMGKALPNPQTMDYIQAMRHLVNEVIKETPNYSLLNSGEIKLLNVTGNAPSDFYIRKLFGH